ncbi:MAG: hypothetical protein LT103_07505 [Burkholderiaceae bacterium]|nr:hypothetical protein [Burkholderiaceae bacterium]QKS30670.1 MAG: hypothetical protein HT579_18150 [Candidatus Accumulibacter similis]
MRITKNGQLIQSVEDWFRYAPPKGGADQWRDGRSAKEFARAWVESGSVSVPDELVALLSSHPDTQSAVLENGEPEARLAFDRRVGEVRNADLAVRAVAGSAPLALTIEAKADEPFDQLVADTLADALDRILERGRGGGVDRVRDLATSLLNPPARGLPPLRLLRYQLLTAVAGSLAWARQLEAPRAVLVIHEFQTSQTSTRELQRNAQDLDLFVTRLTAGTLRGLAVGSLVGPIRVPGDPLFDKPADLYLGKIVRRVSPPGP